MKFFAVFAALIAVTCASSSGWTIDQLSEAIQSPHTSSAHLPYLEHALNEMMAAIFAGEQIVAVPVSIPSVDYSSWTLAEISDAIENPETNPALLPGLEQALNQMMEAITAGAPVAAAGASTVVPAQDLSFWTLAQLSEALESPETSPVMVPYLVDALNHIMQALISGEQMEFIIVATPAGLLPIVEAEVPVVPVMPVVVDQSPVEAAPVVVAPVEANPVEAAAPSSPLVQIIININQQSVSVVDEVAQPVDVVEEAVDAVQVVDDAEDSITVVDQPQFPDSINVVEGAIIPTPVIIEEIPEPVIIVDNSPINPSPVVINPENPGLQPDPEIVANPGLQPDPEMVIAPESVSVANPNPIDVIAVNA